MRNEIFMTMSAMEELWERCASKVMAIGGSVCLKNSVVASILEGLKKRLDEHNSMTVQLEKGFVYRAVFVFHSPASEQEIDQFEKDMDVRLPADFRDFLLLHNGAQLFTDAYAGGGYKLLSLERIRERHQKFKDMPKNLLPISRNNGDYFFIDADRVRQGACNYLVRFDHEDPLCHVKLNFETWLDRLIVSQGAAFWEWKFESLVESFLVSTLKSV